MRRPLPLLLLLALVLAAGAAAWDGAGSGTPGPTGDAGPAGYSASVAGADGTPAATGAATGNWANRSAAASADPALWDQARDRDAARRARTTASRRLGRLVVASLAERLGVPRARLREAVRAAGAGSVGDPGATGALGPRGARAARRDRLAAGVGRELGRSRAAVLRAARAELDARLTQGAGRGIVTDAGRELALGCFDAPDACDVRGLRRALRFAYLLGR